MLDGEPSPAREQKLGGREAFAAALAAYRGGDFGQALRGFEALRVDAPDDACSALYVERSRERLAQGAAADWDGVTDLLTK